MQNKLPIKSMNNKPCKTEVTALSHDGRGIAHVSGKTVFIANALPNEEVTFTYLKRHKNYDEAKAEEILSISPERTLPLCPHFGICGGCSLQHLKHDLQIRLKQQTLLEQLQHFGNCAPQHLLPPLVGPIWGYRNKARLAVKYVEKKGKVLIGFHEKNGRFIADLTICPILHHSIGEKITILSNLIGKLSIFDQIPQIEIAATDLITALVLRHLKEFNDQDHIQLNVFAQQHNFKIYLQPQGINSIHCLHDESPFLSYRLPQHNLELLFHPTDFTQTNHAINQKLIAQALTLMEPNAQDIILDLFCGIGNFSLPLARYSKKVVGIEGEAAMVGRAQANALHNQIENAEFHRADLTLGLATHLAQIKFNKILLDPPRTGALEIIPRIAQLKPQKILYISCNPATLARDLKELVAQKFTLTHAGIIDMFPHTQHVEAMALLSL